MQIKSKIAIRLVLSGLLVWGFCGCGNDNPDRERVDEVSGPALADPSQPLSQAFELLNLNPERLFRYRHLEADYILAARLPIIDDISRSPGHLYGWVDDLSSRMQPAAVNNLSFPLHQIALALNPDFKYRPPPAALPTDADSIEAAYRYLLSSYGMQIDPQAIEHIRSAGLNRDFARHCGRLLRTLADAARLTRIAYAPLSDEDRSFLAQMPERFFFPDGQQFTFLTAATHHQLRILNICRKIDFDALFTAACMLSEALDAYAAGTRGMSPFAESDSQKTAQTVKSGPILELDSPLGRILIVGDKNDRIEDQFALLIDLGGNDHYAPAGATVPVVPGRLSILIDMGGNDTHEAGPNGHTQGFGSLGIGMLVDLGGNDRYSAGNMAQGCGIYGIGLLADLGGSDVYRMGLMGQGFGLFGAGLLLDSSGNDRYLANGMGQGVGSTFGFGYLGDSRGNDRYEVHRNMKRGSLISDIWSHAQGAGLSVRLPDWKRHFSLYGGIGLLNDGNGNDIYYASDGNCMGSSYFMSVGALVDHGGNDQYLPQNGYGMGFAVHLSNGILLDKDGDDIYFSKTNSGGVASDRSLAMLVDLKGNDVYGPSTGFLEQARNKPEQAHPDYAPGFAETSYGASRKPGALGILVDVKGEDRYYFKAEERKPSCGGVIPPAEPYEWSYAAQIDLSGKDYYHDKRQNDRYTLKFGHALGYDADLSEAINMSRLFLTDNDEPDSVEPSSFQASEALAQFRSLAAQSGYDGKNRFSAIGAISGPDASTAKALIDLLRRSEAQNLNRDAMEALSYFVVDPAHRKTLQDDFAGLLDARHPLVRIYASRLIGNFGMQHAMDGLIRNIEQVSLTEQQNRLWAIGQLASAASLEYLLATLGGQKAALPRVAAIRALERCLQARPPTTDKDYRLLKQILRNCLADQNASVRTIAARITGSIASDEALIQSVGHLLEDPNVYVRRAAAKTVVLSGDKNGIPVLIDSLKFPSIDTAEFYDHEIARDLAFYCGVDFVPPQRYFHSTWNMWWQENGESVDLEHNLALMRTIRDIFEDTESEQNGIRRFEQLMDGNPHNIVVRRRFERFCYEWITFRLLTRKQITPRILERIVRLQAIRVELAPQDPGKLATLAYYKARAGRYDAAVNDLTAALQIEPDNADYLKALKEYRSLKNRASQ